nr:sugar porter family MFS transporter [Niabella ginsengisoli]
MIGCIVGVAFSGEMSDRWGRKKPMFISAFFFLISAIGAALVPTLTGVFIFRFIGGLGIGLTSNLVPLYISEIAPAKTRGRLVTLYQFALTLGILCAYLSNAFLVKYSETYNIQSSGSLFEYVFLLDVWRGMLLVGGLPALLFLAGMFFVPESPRWLMQRNRSAEALTIMRRFSNDEVLELPKLQTDSSSADSVSYRELFKGRWRKAMIVGILLPLFSQFSGINAIIYYGPSILNDAGVSMNNSLMSQVVFGVANMLFTLLAIWKVDTLGRRPLYIYGTLGATIALVLTGICFATGASTSVFILISVLMFLACFAFSIGPLKFVVASEIFPGHIRGRAMALSIMVMWVADAIVGQITPIMLKHLGTPATFWVFATFCFIAFIVVYKILPETKGKSLEQIEEGWLKEKGN